MSTSSNAPPEIPLLHDGDSFLIDARPDGLAIRLHAITMFGANQNTEPVSIRLFDLTRETRQVVLRQILHRYPGKVILT